MLKLGDDNNVYKKKSKNLIYLIYLIYFLMINKKTILLRDFFLKQSVLKIRFTHPSNMQYAVVLWLISRWH